MTTFTFIHAADLHLGSPLAGLAGRNADLAERFATAGREAFSALVTHAIASEAAFFLVAGDVFDGEWTDLTIGLFFARELARLDRAGIPFAYVRGNHDAASIVRKTVTLPAATIEFPSAKASTHSLDRWRVAVHGRSFPERTVPADFVASYPAPVPGWFNIGLLHTSCDGHPNHADYAPCSTAELAAKGYEYWALGHVHDFREVSRDPFIVYPGNLQGRSVKECGPKGAVAVDVADGRVVAVRHLVFDRARFAHLDLAIDDAEGRTEVLEAMKARLRPHVAEGGDRPIAVRITLRGAKPAFAGDPEGLEADLQAAAHQLHPDAWIEKVRVRTVRPARSTEAQASPLDPAVLLAELDRDPDVRARAKEIVAEMKARLPGGMAANDEGELADDLDQLFAEAEATVMARLAGRGC